MRIGFRSHAAFMGASLLDTSVLPYYERSLFEAWIAKPRENFLNIRRLPKHEKAAYIGE